MMEIKIDLRWDDGHVVPSKIYPDLAFLLQRMNEATAAETEVSNGEMVLDVGCGRAVDIMRLAKRGAKCIGLEPSNTMISHAKKSISDSGMGVNLIQGVAEYMPFKPNSLDKVMCKGALDHFPHPAKTIEEMARVLKPRGKAIIAVSNSQSLGFRIGRSIFLIWKILPGRKIDLKKFYQMPPDHSYKFDYAFLRRMVEPHFQVDRSIGISLLYGLPYWSLLLAMLPKGVSLATLSTLDKLARYLPWLSDAIVLKCSPKPESKSQLKEKEK